ncbi:MAG TPA: hypothetical protein VFP27_19750, partial [Mycobacterium sp.]|nr:hypothetical protein [Mycobacterium sp.]
VCGQHVTLRGRGRANKDVPMTTLPRPPDPTLRDRRRPAPQTFRDTGPRVLTLPQVAAILQVDLRIVKKLVALQAEEDAFAIRESRTPRVVGLRAKVLSPRVRRIVERELGRYLHDEK